MLQSFAKSSFREMLDRASRTQPSSNIRPLHSLDKLASLALNATPTVVDCECALDKLTRGYKDALEEAEVYIATLKSEFEAKITAAEIALDKAISERRKAQFRLIRQQVEMGVFEGVKNIDELAREKEETQ